MSLNLNEALAGKYLKATDIPKGKTITLQINDVEQQDLSQKQDGSEKKPVMTFVEEGSKPMVLNKTNIGMLVGIYGPEPADYLGKMITIRHDPSVTNPGGQLVGGLRFVYPQDDNIPA